jgi:predicted nuclease of predicted toxin-antitoxin system
VCGLSFYLDECVPAPVTDALRASGHDAIHAVELGHRGEADGWSDRSQLEFAVREGRVLVTQNRWDFRREHDRLIAESGSHHGILLLSAKYDPSILAAALHEYLTQLRGNLHNMYVLVSVPR